ncbi:glycosyltransferase family 4 protein [Patescibacteria group bacterium]|nr:glycosyltransferase family 4 protein [Patescibacteria group bacterium]MBU4389677.1 glycosyltransferase family 4 protein [Patescibacteria group bacterium]MBU4397038.1 glycosyltransferase family 4 protein [Patescibacteria group bacterium]MBU4430668.1 glycosyltransferase family 4 protein [Patescibacteria group bacterium]MBU4579095.1 glycosyltransferase family 4 protein [Patescibacteria group bacterium]
MIIGIDISSIPYGTGVSNYTRELVKNLVKIDKTNTYKLFFSSLRQPLPPEIKKLKKHSNVKIFHFRLPITLLEILFNKLHILPVESFIGKCDVFHTSDWTQPPARQAKLITTIHDLTPFIYPQWLDQKIISTHTQKMKLATKHCSHFICVSKNTQKDLLKLFPKINSNTTSVIYEAVAKKYSKFYQLKQKCRGDPCGRPQIQINQIKKKYGLDDFILAQGTREPRKNLSRLIKAFTNFKLLHPTSNLQLAIAGKYGWGNDICHPAASASGWKRSRGICQQSSIKILGYIPEKDMVPLHAAAIALIYPSLYEGFGLPILKAMSIGTPVITSNTSSMPEVAGNATILINPKSTQSIKNAIQKIAISPKLHQSLIKKGLIQASKFSWTKTAHQTLQIYKKMLL